MVLLAPPAPAAAMAIAGIAAGNRQRRRGTCRSASVVLCADESLDLVEREGVTILHGFEAHIKALVEAQEAQPRNLSSLRTGIFAAGPHSATPIIRKAQKVLAPMKSVSGFGMTETWPGIAIGSLDDDEFHRCETSGYPALGYQFRIIDPETGPDLLLEHE